MYENIGNKIKILAIIMCVIGIISSVIGGIMCCAADEDLIGAGIGIILGGVLSAFIGSFLIYGFGELIDRAVKIEQNTRKDDRPSDVQAKIETKRIKEIEKLRYQGLITEEEYQNAVKKEKQ